MSLNAKDDDIPAGLLERAELLQSIVVSYATDGSLGEEKYRQIRQGFVKSRYKEALPKFIRNCRDFEHLWAHLKGVASGSGSYAKRRKYVYDAFAPFLEMLEGENETPADDAITKTLSSFDRDGIGTAWERALNRRDKDPAGAITAARTLLEDVCKRILDDAGKDYGNDDLPKLYRKTAETLNLSPTQHDEKIFKTILGWCQTVVENLGTLRNRLGDAHGQGKKRARPLPRHAELAVNLAGSMATFLVETWRAKSKDS